VCCSTSHFTLSSWLASVNARLTSLRQPHRHVNMTVILFGFTPTSCFSIRQAPQPQLRNHRKKFFCTNSFGNNAQ